MTRLNTLSTLLSGLVLGALITLAAWTAFAGRRPGVAQPPEQERREAAATRATATAVLETIRQRRTVRSYEATPVPDEDLLAILDAARFAPTAGNQQPWRFLVIRDRDKLNQLKVQALEWYMDRVRSSPNADQQDIESIRSSAERALQGALSAPVYVAVLVDTQAPHSRYVVYDGTLAAANLMIAARALGYGTGFFTTFFPEDEMKAFFGIPDHYSLICFTPIGVPEEWPETPAKKGLGELLVLESFE